MEEGAPQFGRAEPGLAYAERPAAFGLALRDGRLACVRVERSDMAAYLDLPGGAIDPGEDAREALRREFLEETGLKVRAVEEIARADQRFRKSDGAPVNNRAAFFTAEIEGEAPEAKVEDDHTLVWLDPVEALRSLRHEAHAWAVAAWLRRRTT